MTPSRPSLLVIEDDPDILEIIRYNLERNGFRVETATSGEAGFKKAQSSTFGLILLDLMLPGLQGLEVCRQLRQRPATASVPILMLTAKGEESDVVLGLELGADDYVTKPFNVSELMARVRALLRRARLTETPDSGAQLSAGDLEIDSDRHEVRVAGRLVSMTLAEFRVLSALVSNPGRVMTRAQLLDHITDGKSFIVDRNIDVHIRSIRRKLGSEAHRIVTVRGVGYKCASI